MERPQHVVVVGASAGGVEALRSFVSGLPRDLLAAVLVVLHLPVGGTSALAAILGRSGPLTAATARHGAQLAAGVVQVAPPDHHLLVVDDGLALSHGPTENGHRPAINALFRSAAVAKGPAVTGVLLSGSLDDGVAGLLAIAARGGHVMVQNPQEALYPQMPNEALRHVRVDHVLDAARMGEVLAKITEERVDMDGASPPSPLVVRENEIANNGGKRGTAAGHDGPLGPPSGFACPECQGTLLDVDTARYRCQVGHAWTADALLEAQGSAVERALWTALRALDEKARLSWRMHDYAFQLGGAESGAAERYRRTAEEATDAADVLRRSLTATVPQEPDVP